MAVSYAAQIHARQPEGPIQMIGWSMGGLISIEIARNLQERQREVLPLIMLDTHLSLRDPALEEITEESILKQIAPRVGLSLKDLRKMPIEQQWDQVLKASQELMGDSGADTGVEEIRRLAVMCKAHLLALGRYKNQPIDLDVYMFQAAKPWRLSDPRWKGLCTKFTCKTVPGTHYSMLAQPDVAKVASAIADTLRNIASCTGGSE